VHDLSPITALGGTAPRIDTVGDTTLTEVPGVALASVAARTGQETACAARLQTLLQTEPPGPGKSVAATPYAALWTGPDQWMVSAAFDTHEDIAALVKTHMGDTASVTEQTDAWACFVLHGPGTNAVLELLCNIKLATVAAQDATRTSIHHLGCFVICAAPASQVRILGPRASAGSLHHAITTAMTSAL